MKWLESLVGKNTEKSFYGIPRNLGKYLCIKPKYVGHSSVVYNIVHWVCGFVYTVMM
jgi:hypothetical protein